LDFTSTQGVVDNTYSFIWLIFALFIGIALAVDMGLLGKPMRRIKKSLFRLNNNNIDKNKGSSSQKEKEKEEIRTVITSPKDSITKTQRLQQVQTFRRALQWTILWISLACVFAIIVYIALGQEKALLFVTGYALEKSLSVDNMFVFLIIFSSLGIPYVHQHKVLMVGILSAIALRIGLILAGVSLLESFHWMIYVFGGLLLFTGIRMLIQKKEKKVEIEKNIAVRIMKKFIPVSLELNGDKFLSHKNGMLLATPMLIALVIIEMTDLVFALDSIPAILAITTDSFIVITSNIFAILGLRSLYFLLAGMMEKFYYLKPGLAAILLFIGIKMIISEFYQIPITGSLLIIFGILAVAMTLSFIRSHSRSLIVHE
jgi:TerC family integral membrane protein